MDKQQRLKMLFDGDDGFLLSTDVTSHLAPESHDAASLPQAYYTPINPIGGDSGTSAKQNTTTGSLSNSDSDEGFDEYLASFSRVAARKDSRITVTKPVRKNQKDGQGNVENQAADTSRSSSAPKEPPCLVSGARSFCPIAGVSRFPYKYIRSGDADAIAKRFFDAGKFWNRCWDL